MSRTVRYQVQLRAAVDGNTLAGHAAVFGQVARVPGGWERMAPTAFDQVLDASDTDVVALVNHDMGLLLGRQSAGTLRLKTDDTGLLFEVDLPDTGYARDLRALVARGDITGASIGFVPGEERYLRAPDGARLVEHVSVARLRDVSPVTTPAYAGTDVALRAYDFDRVSARSRLIRARHRARYAHKEG